MMEFQSPPTSLTGEEIELRDEYRKRCEYARDLLMAADLLKWKWYELPLSPVPLEIKFHVLEEDTVTARHEFEARSLVLEEMHSPEEGYYYRAYGYKHNDTIQHFAELKIGHGNVRYVVVWIEQDQTQKEES